MTDQQHAPGSPDVFNLQRFISAQAPLYPTVIAELEKGDKRTHWMWFIFPQVAGLGNSDMAQRYAISPLEEARAYLQHPGLGERLLECTSLMLQIDSKTAHQVLGSPDDQKLQSCMTLFSLADTAHPLFVQVLDKYYSGKKDHRTLALLQAQ